MKKHLYISKAYYKRLSEEYGSFFKAMDISFHLYDEDVFLSSTGSFKVDKGSSDKSVSIVKSVLNIVFLNESFFLSREEKYSRLVSVRDCVSFILVSDDLSASPPSFVDNLKDIFYHRVSFPVERQFFEYLVSSMYTLLRQSSANRFSDRYLPFRKKHISFVVKVSRLVYSDLSYNVIIKRIVRIAKRVISCDEIIIHQVKRYGEHIFSRCIFPYGVVEEFVPVDGKTFAGNVALRGKLLFHNDKSKIDKYCINRTYDLVDEIKSIMVIPIKGYDKEVHGVVEFINKSVGLDDEPLASNEAGIFSEYDKDLAISLSLYISMLIKLNEISDKKEEIKELTQIGKALSTERRHSRLLNFILNKSKDITNCDTGTIYLVEGQSDGSKCLRFVYSPLTLEHKDLTIPIDNNSISGYVALTKNVLNIPDAYLVRSEGEYKLNFDYDKKHNYRTKSMLVVPMTNQKDEVTGVIQLINKKRYKDTVLSSRGSFEKEVIPFVKDDVEIVMAIAGQAAVSIENNTLYNDIENMLEGFVKASVTAIESRDPTTSGHSERVAKYTIKLARLVSRIGSGKWKDVEFSREQIRELKYASLLHDFGKVGVRENVLVKASKLYPSQLELIKSRFDFIKRTLEQESYERRIAYLLENSRETSLRFIEREDIAIRDDLAEIDRILASIIKANNPLIKKGDVPLLSFDEIAKRTYNDIHGRKQFFLSDNECLSLSISKGSLKVSERKEIESHVSHTFSFLKTIPWTREFKNLPKIAYAHHEKLDGSGYPRGIKNEAIPIQSKIMTIADIYDALVAGDRPYKRRLKASYSLDILREEVKSNHIDDELVRIFIEGKVYKTK